MRTTLTLIFLLFSFVNIIANSIDTEPSDNLNLINNPGFEQDIRFATGWSFYKSYDNANDDLELVSAANTGDRALHLTTTLDNSTEWTLWTSLRDVNRLKVSEGDTLIYSLFIDAKSAAAGVYKSFITYDDTGTEIDLHAGEMQLFEYDGFILYSHKFIIPSGVAYVTPRLTGKGACDIIVDDFSLTGTFQVSLSAQGNGSVSTNGFYTLGSKVKIEATPGTDSKFAGWIGDFVSDKLVDTVELTDGDLNIIARFVDEGVELVHKFYIATTGDDEGGDGSLASPWATVTYGSSQLYPGDTLIIQAGNYSRAYERITNSGGNGKYITILGEEGAVFDLSTKGHEYGAFGITDASWVILDGITVKNTKTHGIKVLGKCDNIIIRNCRTEHTAGCGILIQGSRGYPWDRGYYISDILLDNNQIHWPQEAYFDGTPEDQLPSHEDITLMQGVEHFEIRNCYVNAYDTTKWHGGPLAIDVKDGVRYGKVHHNTVTNIPSGGLYLDAWDTYCHHIDFYNNHVSNTTGFGINIGAERGGPIDSVKVYNNIVVRQGWGGILSGDYNGGDGKLYDKTHIDIFNNTLYQCGFGGVDGWQANGILTESSWKESKVYNNIMLDCYPNAMKLNRNDNNIVTNNCLYKSSGVSDSGDEGKNAVKENPQFIDAANWDFHLKPISPCIDAGTSDGAPAFDYDGTERPLGNGYDIGAFEVEGTTGINNEELSDFILLAYPNPFTGVVTISYTLKNASNVKMSIRDLSGREIRVLVNQHMPEGDHEIQWDAADFPAGIYFYHIKNANWSITKKMILTK